MTVRTITEGDAELTLTTDQVRPQFGPPYWRCRAEFWIGHGHAKVDITTNARHDTEEDAERAALKMAHDNGWGSW